MMAVSRHRRNRNGRRSRFRFIQRNFNSISRSLACINSLRNRIGRNHEAGISRSDTVFFQVQAVDFFFCRNAQAHGGVEDAEDNIDGDEDVEGDDTDAENLNEEEVGFSRIEQAIFDAEQSRQDSA